MLDFGPFINLQRSLFAKRLKAQDLPSAFLN
jgi:hypothetical protein